MIILESIRDQSLILIFGLGTVGSAILRKLQSQPLWETRTCSYPWTKQAINEREKLWGSLHQSILKRGSAAKVKLDIVWSAGKAGMSSDEASTGLELMLYHQMIDAVRSLEQLRNVRIRIHHISSIGALFEGIRNINKSTAINPQRPYGFLKQRQERLLMTLVNTSSISYRLSSVFDSHQAGKRNGLIPTVLQNAQLHRPMTIWGRLTTLRDYVWNHDIATYVVKRLASEHSLNHEVEYLASGKPTSIREIISTIELTLGRRIVFQNTICNLHNDLDITVSQQVLPKSFRVTPLKTSIYLANQKNLTRLE